MVYCQSSDSYGSVSLSKAEPIASAKVSAVCKNQRGQVNFYKAFETDPKDYFFAEFQGYEMSHSLLDHPLQSCVVNLVGSPLVSCNVISNVNNSLLGSPLRYQSKRLHRKDYDVVIYAAGPLAFRPPHCPAQLTINVIIDLSIQSHLKNKLME
ncbi:sorting and assembly machinery component 50-like protein B-like [Hibiscus syriacus]|uniref:Sorting and assembly machinery component 50-like protein B-like n=2 Tax=Hibiscus syriacus TaxID=106335 RepID=A0A6A3BAU6_HIBSY|nr:sorting and assembly machinery component 50-like protein B-like [Hibiscus syriacus]